MLQAFRVHLFDRTGIFTLLHDLGAFVVSRSDEFLKDRSDDQSAGFIDHEFLLDAFIAKGGIAPFHNPFFAFCSNLSRIRSEVISLSN
jgi:hypothetical protein